MNATKQNSRLKYLRNWRGMTQKNLGLAIGCSKGCADVRIAQYESGKRCPKPKMVAALAEVLDISSYALCTPQIANETALMHLLFALEDKYGFQIDLIDSTLCIRLDNVESSLFFRLSDWFGEMALLKEGLQTKAEYDQWRYSYPSEEGGE